MGFFKSKADMYEARAKHFEKNGKIHWAKAKNGDGDFHFGKAKKHFEEANRNKKLAKDARKKS